MHKAIVRKEFQTTINDHDPGTIKKLDFEIMYGVNEYAGIPYGVRIKANGIPWITISYLGESASKAEGIGIDSWSPCTTCFGSEEVKYKTVCLDILFEQLNNSK